jgi:hypothetical protein
MSNDAEQMGQFVRQRKRMAMGVKLDGSSLGHKEGGHVPAKHHHKAKKHHEGGLAHMKKK